VAALQTVSLAVRNGTYWLIYSALRLTQSTPDSLVAITSKVIPEIPQMFQDQEKHVRVTALRTFSAVAKLDRGEKWIHYLLPGQTITAVMIYDVIPLGMPEIMSAMNSDREIQIAALETLTTLSRTGWFNLSLNVCGTH
jgi:hypothetical protein